LLEFIFRQPELGREAVDDLGGDGGTEEGNEFPEGGGILTGGDQEAVETGLGGSKGGFDGKLLGEFSSGLGSLDQEEILGGCIRISG